MWPALRAVAASSIRAHDHLQQDGHIGDRAGHGARRIADPIERYDAGAGHQAHRGTEPDQRIMCRGHAHRTAGVRADAHDTEVRRQRRRRAPEEPPVARVVGVAGKAGEDGIDVVAAPWQIRRARPWRE